MIEANGENTRYNNCVFTIVTMTELQIWLGVTWFRKHEIVKLLLSEGRKHAAGQAKFFLALKSERTF